MSRENLAVDFAAWVTTATAGEMVTILRAVASELLARGWPTSGACFLAASELQRFIEIHPARFDSRG